VRRRVAGYVLVEVEDWRILHALVEKKENYRMTANLNLLSREIGNHFLSTYRFFYLIAAENTQLLGLYFLKKLTVRLFSQTILTGIV